MSLLKFVMTILLGLFLNLPEFADAHDPYTVAECVDYGKMMQGTAEARDLGKPLDWIMQKAMDYILLRQNQKGHPFFVKDDQDMEYVLGGINLVYHKQGTPKEFYNKSYDACIEVLVGTKKP